jgi:DNA-binding winged helix-turn-helix (wHTH) protein
MRIRFGPFVLDQGTRELLHRARVVEVSPKAFRLLEVLIERRPQAVSKDDLQDLLWPGVYVAEGNLSRLMNEVRKALGDHAEKPRFIRTVHGFGYAFSGEAEADAAAPPPAVPAVLFKISWQDREIALREGENILGRDQDAVAWIDDARVSRHHARILVSRGEAVLEDLGSRNGTLLQGKKITSSRPLSDGNEIQIGSTRIRFRRYVSGVTTRDFSASS